MKTKKILGALMAIWLATLACSLGGEASTPVPVDACFHPYFPVVAGATWVYELSGFATDTYTHSILSKNGNEFTDQDVFGVGTTRTGQWKCEDGNMIALTPGGDSASVGADGQTFSFTVTSNTGVTLPANLEVGSAWSQEIAYEGTQDVGGSQITSHNQAVTSCTVTGRESVTVPAGTFDALKVECTSKISISIAGSSEPFVIEGPSTAWYVEGIGMVKTDSSGNGFDSVVVLKSWQIP